MLTNSQSRRLYIPALIIVVVVLVLLVFIGFSTYWNLNRARTHALTFLRQQGAAIIDVLQAGGRTLTALPGTRDRAIDRLIREAAENDSVAYIYLADARKHLLLQSAAFDPGQEKIWVPDGLTDGRIISRIRPAGHGAPVYEMARRFEISPPGARLHFSMDPYDHAVIVIGLKMSTFASARHEDFHHAIVMMTILVMLGGGGIFFMFVINRYHRMNRQLKEVQDYTRQVVDSMANGLLSIDAEGRVLSYNSLGLELLGMEPAHARGMRLDDVLDFDECGISETLARCLPVMDREIWLKRSSAEKMPLAVSTTPIPADNASCSGAVIILRDLREIRRLEEKVRRTEKLAALGKLAAAVAHEIRNPLSSIRGFAQFLGHVLKDRPQDREYATVMVKEVDRINRVVSDLINFARPLEPELSPVDPGKLVEHTIRLVGGDAAAKDVLISKHLQPGMEPVMLDANLMTQVLLNLLLNSLQAVSGGQKQVDIGAVRSAMYMTFWVEDDGPGIPDENQVKIFDPFFTTRDKGTGLGLAIVAKIVENHHGKIRLESPPPERSSGCRFTIEIPLDLEARN